MKINADLVQELRESRSWTQEELAIASGLTRRTVQRIEREGLASLQSKKALASAFEIDVDDLTFEERTAMVQWEYKTVEMPFRFGVFKQGTPDIEGFLNVEGDKGWRLHQVVVQASSNFGQSERMIAILERQKS